MITFLKCREQIEIPFEGINNISEGPTMIAMTRYKQTNSAGYNVSYPNCI